MATTSRCHHLFPYARKGLAKYFFPLRMSMEPCPKEATYRRARRHQARRTDRLSVFEPHSSLNKGRAHNITYGGSHDHGSIERGDQHIETLVTTRPWLVNTRDISIQSRHEKSLETEVNTIWSNDEPHFNQYGPPVFTRGGQRNGLSYH